MLRYLAGKLRVLCIQIKCAAEEKAALNFFVARYGILLIHKILYFSLLRREAAADRVLPTVGHQVPCL